MLVDEEWWGIPASREGLGCWLGCCRWPLKVRPWWRRDSWRVPSATTAYSPTDWERSGDRSSRRTRSDNSPPRRVARMESIRNPATQSKIIIILRPTKGKRKRKNEETSTSGIRRISPCHNFHPHAKKENGKKGKSYRQQFQGPKGGKKKSL